MALRRSTLCPRAEWGPADAAACRPARSWCTDGECGRDVCTESEVRSVADAIVSSGLRELGFRTVSLDDCWADRRAADGTIVEDPQRFPSGIRALADYMHARDLVLGLYTDAGEYTCSQGGRPHRIPGSFGHYEQDARTYAAWGVDMIKMDWCNTLLRNGTQLDPRWAYPTMARALNATGRRIVFSACEWGVASVWQWGRAAANLWRMGPDHADRWSSTAAIIERSVGLAPYAGPGGWNDPDFLFTGGEGCRRPDTRPHCPGQTDTEYRTEFGMWCLLTAPLIVATDVRQMTAVQRATLFNRELIAVNQDPLGKQADRVGFAPCAEGRAVCQVWAKSLRDGALAVGLYNAGQLNNTFTVDFALLGAGWANASLAIRDLWAQRDLGIFRGSFAPASAVPSHGLFVYRMALAMPPL